MLRITYRGVVREYHYLDFKDISPDLHDQVEMVEVSGGERIWFIQQVVYLPIHRGEVLKYTGEMAKWIVLNIANMLKQAL